MNSVEFKFPLIFAGVGLIGAMVLLVFFWTDTFLQPIEFNHKKHTENNVECQMCHAFALKSAKAGIPSVAVCTRCHEDVVYVSAEKKKLLNYVKSQTEIPWKTVYEVPHHVLFSHRRHVVAGKLACSACHGEVTNKTSPFMKQDVKLSMEGCIECHRASSKNPNECLTCHR